MALRRWTARALMSVRWMCSQAASFPSSPNVDITEKDLLELPQFKYSGVVRIIRGSDGEDRFHRDLVKLSQAEVLGFNTETCIQGSGRAPCIIQLTTDEVCFLWRIRRMSTTGNIVTWLSPNLVKILMSNQILKVGHSSITDSIELLKHYNLEMYNVQDTFQLAAQIGLQQLSLRGLVGMFLGHRLDTDVTTNWESTFLSDKQILHASSDAWASLKVYEALIKYMDDKGYNPPVPVKRAFSLLKPSDQEKLLEKISEQDSLNGRKHKGGNGFSNRPTTPSFGDVPVYQREESSDAKVYHYKSPSEPPVYIREEYEKRTTQKWYYHHPRYWGGGGMQYPRNTTSQKTDKVEELEYEGNGVDIDEDKSEQNQIIESHNK